MSERSNAQLTFVTDYHSDAWIARESGIPRSTIGFVRRGERDLPEQYSSEIRRLYQREAYSIMRDTGFSATEARRFSAYAPATTSTVIYDVEQKINMLAKGYVASVVKAAEQRGERVDIDSVLRDGLDKIRAGFAASELPKEEWDKYGDEEAS